MSGTAARSLAAVVLNYRTPYDTVLAVRSLQSQSRPPDHVIVVDNASEDDSLRVFDRFLRSCDVIEAEHNLGYSGGCNVGIRHALNKQADVVMLVNGDVVLGQRTIELLEEAVATPGVGIAGPVLLSRADPSRIDAAGLEFGRLSGRFRVRGAGLRSESFPFKTAAEPSAVMGCVMLVDRRAFEAVGLLDEAYFFSFEDLDFCWRSAAAGWRAVCVEDAHAYHAGSLSIGPQSPIRIYYATRNHLRCAARVAPVAWPVGLTRAKLIAFWNLAHALRCGWGGTFASVQAWARGVWHHLRRRYGAFSS